MFDEVFGGVNPGGLLEKKPYCPCGCACVCWEGEEQRVSNTDSRGSTVHDSDYTVNPIPD